MTNIVSIIVSILVGCVLFAIFATQIYKLVQVIRNRRRKSSDTVNNTNKGEKEK